MERLNVTNIPSNMQLSTNVMNSTPNPPKSKFWLFVVALAIIAAIIYFIKSIFKAQEAKKEAEAATKASNAQLLNIIQKNDVIKKYVNDKLKDGQNTNNNPTMD